MGSFLSDLILFIYTVLSYWQAYLTGGLITAGVSLFERVTDLRLTKRVYVGLFVITFLLASFFLAWRGERKAVDNAQKTLGETQKSLEEAKHLLLREKGVPKLGGRIEQMIIRESPDGKGTQIFIHLSIGNTGGPSKVDNFLLNVKSPEIQHKDKKGPDFQYKDKPAIFPKETISVLDEKKRQVMIQYQDSMDAKMVKPIESGNRVDGWLMFFVEGVNPEIIQRPKTEFTIFFKDVWGQEYSATSEMTQHSENP